MLVRRSVVGRKLSVDWGRKRFVEFMKFLHRFFDLIYKRLFSDLTWFDQQKLYWIFKIMTWWSNAVMPEGSVLSNALSFRTDFLVYSTRAHFQTTLRSTIKYLIVYFNYCWSNAVRPEGSVLWNGFSFRTNFLIYSTRVHIQALIRSTIKN